ncbi:MAG: helix-turn-helix transcriptional regulator [Hyphomicrobiaceae bacterium]|nr:helix-turn-helix transcriptional regulator [Hyphomicrobiaceae bacterium]
MTDQDLLLDFIDCIYECGSGGQSWTVFLKKFDRQFPALKSGLIGYDDTHPHLNFALLGNYEEEFATSYVDYYHKLNPWYDMLQEARPLELNIWAHEVVPLDTLQKTEFYHDWVEPQGDIATGFTSNLSRTKGCFINLACNISLDHLEEGEQARHFLLTLEPHLKRSFAISRRLGGTKLREKTMEEARYLLKETDAKIRIIAEDLGFTSAAYFTRVFTETYGQSPKIFRKTTLR